MKLIAERADFLDDGYATFLTFAQAEEKAQGWFILSFVNFPYDEDQFEGSDTIHVEIFEQMNSAYGLVRSIELDGDTVVIELGRAIGEYGPRVEILAPAPAKLDFALQDAVATFQARIKPP